MATEMQITCRCCECPAPAQPDGVLLCPDCRRDPAGELARARALADAALHALDAAHEDLPFADEPRLLAVWSAWRAAHQAGAVTLAAFDRRYQATVALGGPLANTLLLWTAYREAKAWLARVEDEFTALADAQEEAHDHAA